MREGQGNGPSRPSGGFRIEAVHGGDQALGDHARHSVDAARDRLIDHRLLAPAERAFTEATYADFIGDNQGAVTALRTVVRLDPGNATAWGNLGSLLLYRMADDSGALIAMRRALEASGHAAARFAPVINAELANRHPKAARRVLDSLQAAAPGSPA